MIRIISIAFVLLVCISILASHYLFRIRIISMHSYIGIALSYHMENIRNFCIIAHIDHGKSTLADRLLEFTGTIEKRRMKEQYLDQLELERERGITIKMAPVRMVYRPAEILNYKSEIRNKSQIQNSNDRNKNFEFQNDQKILKLDHSKLIQNSELKIQNLNSEYILNLIDTPGHSDFSYEVSRALAAVEGAILLVDATQGIQAQTLSNFYKARAAGLKIIGAVNKIDLFQNKNDERIKTAVKEIANLLSVEEKEIHLVSGKTGEGVSELLETIIQFIPFPKNQISNYQLPITNYSRALIFDSFYDNHRGVIASVRVFDGEFHSENEILLIARDAKTKIKEVGYFSPELKIAQKISTGEIGYIATGIKDPGKIKIGDTIINSQLPITNYQLLSLPGYIEPQPVVFVSFYPENPDDFELLMKGLEKLKLNDSSLKTEPDQNEVLGRGFKVGFLGRLHFEIVAERLKREFNIATVNTFPSVMYKVKDRDGYKMIIKPEDFTSDIEEIWEPMVKLEILLPNNCLGNVLSLREKYRLSAMNTETFEERIKIIAQMPLAELVSDFDDQLKSLSGGYASFSYELADYIKADIVKVDIVVVNKQIAGLSRFFHKTTYEREGRMMIERLKDLLPRQQFAQSLQAVANGRVIAREDIPALRKDVTGYLYGGDRTRNMKLLQKQKRGKKKLKEMADVQIPSSVFKELMKK